MQNLKRILPIIPLFAFVACGPKNGSHTSLAVPPVHTLNSPEPTQPIPVATDPFVLEQTYTGPHLTLIYPQAENKGVITLTGDDAKALFNVLAVRTVTRKGHANSVTSYVREGYDISCSAETPKASRSKEYTCAMEIDYRAGMVTSLVTQIHVLKSVPDPKDSYIGKNLTLVPRKTQSYSVITLKDQDAEALYATLSAEPVIDSKSENEIWEAATTKTTPNMSCFEQASKANPQHLAYGCSVYFNYRNGQVLPQGN